MFSRLAIVALLAFAACDSQPPAAAQSNAPAASADASGSEVVARIGGEEITLSQLDAEAAASLIDARQKMYEARRNALETMISESLLEEAAKAKNQTTEEFLAAEVESKVTAATDAEVEAFYAEKQGQIRGTLDQAREQIRKYLTDQRKQTEFKTLLDGLKAAKGVEVLLDPPRIDVPTGDSPRFGNPDAPVQIVEFSDFQCPYCTRGASTLDEVKEAYGDKVTVVYRHFPLSFHKEAHKAAQASECANDQSKFWEYHDLLFANQRALTEPDLVSYAEQLSLNMGDFTECLNSGKHAATVDEDMAEGAAVGMQGTPGFFINGRFLNGAQPFEAFKEIIDAELARKQG